jgi:hypothetical protein
VVIAVVLVRVMQVSPNQIIKVVAMWHTLMPAARTMNVIFLVSTAIVIWCAAIRIRYAHFNSVPGQTLAARTVQMAIVKIIDVTIMLHRCVTATTSMGVATT